MWSESGEQAVKINVLWEGDICDKIFMSLEIDGNGGWRCLMHGNDC